MIAVRPATEADLPAILDLYNASIRTTTTWSDDPQPLADRIAWFKRREAAGDAVLVATDDDAVVGFAAYGAFRDNTLWPGYRFTVENTIHVDEAHHGRGIGRALMDALVAHGAANGKHAIIAAVDGDNDASIAFHRACGFAEVGRLAQVGRKFDRWLDLVLMQRILG